MRSASVERGIDFVARWNCAATRSGMVRAVAAARSSTAYSAGIPSASFQPFCASGRASSKLASLTLSSKRVPLVTRTSTVSGNLVDARSKPLSRSAGGRSKPQSAAFSMRVRSSGLISGRRRRSCRRFEVIPDQCVTAPVLVDLLCKIRSDQFGALV